MVLNAVSPNLTPADRETRRMDMVDALLILRDVGATPLNSSGDTDPLEIQAEKIKYYTCRIVHESILNVTGTAFWELTIQVSFNSAQWVDIRTIRLDAAARDYRLALEGMGIEEIRAAAGQTEAMYLRINAALTSTAGPLTFYAYLTCS